MNGKMRYITFKERKNYEKLALKYNVQGYTPPQSLMCSRDSSKSENNHTATVNATGEADIRGDSRRK